MPAPPVEWTLRTVRAPAKDLLTEREVCACLEVGRSALHDLIAQRKFPGPVLLSPRTKRWKWEWVVGYLIGLDMEKWMVPVGEVNASSDPVAADSTSYPKKRAANHNNG